MKIFIAIPSKDGNMRIETTFSLIQNIAMLMKFGHDVKVEKVVGSPYVVIARNALVKRFLESKYDLLVFVDCDLSFGQNAIQKLVESDKSICVGVYPFKEDARFYSAKPVVNEDKKIHTQTINNDLYVELMYGATGLMCIKRLVIESMVTAYNELKYVNRYGEQYSLFDTGHFDKKGEPSVDGNEWVGEDYLFCRRWRALKGEIWCYPNIDFEHIGNGHTARGNYLKYITGK
jgi:hypothetical protein